MKIKKSIWISLIILSVTSLSFTSLNAAASDDQEAVTNAVSQFYVALNTLFTGDADHMKQVWSHADDVTYMGPAGGLQVGWDQVRAYWEHDAALKLGGKVEPVDMHITVGQDLAITSNFEKGENTNANGKTVKVSIRATNLFRKEAGEWKMIGHHTDLLPYMQK